MATLNVTIQPGNYTLTASDSGLIVLTKTSGQVITVPKNADQAIEVGTIISLVQDNTGQTTIRPASTVVIKSSNGLKARKRYSVMTLVKTDTDVWILSGDLTA